MRPGIDIAAFSEQSVPLSSGCADGRDCVGQDREGPLIERETRVPSDAEQIALDDFEELIDWPKLNAWIETQTAVAGTGLNSIRASWGKADLGVI